MYWCAWIGNEVPNC